LSATDEKSRIRIVILGQWSGSGSVQKWYGSTTLPNSNCTVTTGTYMYISHLPVFRIKKKPYVEMTDSEGKDDVEVIHYIYRIGYLVKIISSYKIKSRVGMSILSDLSNNL
jgi:hypothetical protein